MLNFDHASYIVCDVCFTEFNENLRKKMQLSLFCHSVKHTYVTDRHVKNEKERACFHSYLHTAGVITV